MRAGIGLRSIAQHRRLNLVKIEGSGLLPFASPRFTVRARHLLKKGSRESRTDPLATEKGQRLPAVSGFVPQFILSRNSSSALPIFSSLFVSTTVKFGLATYQKCAWTWCLTMKSFTAGYEPRANRPLRRTEGPGCRESWSQSHRYTVPVAIVSASEQQLVSFSRKTQRMS